MNNKYGHIVYTRCSPCRTLNGDVEKRQGFGIHIISSDLVDKTKVRDVEFQNEIIPMFNTSDPADKRFIDSYVYIVPPAGDAMMAKIHARTPAEMEAAVGVDSRFNHVNEWLVGHFDRYPIELVDSEFWKAADEPVASYYAEDIPPLEDPIPAENIQLGPLSRQAALDFANDSRVEAVKAAVWMILKQFDMPAHERKFLVIRDSEPNVRLWIAAITYSLPQQLALKIGFNTNMAKLNDDNLTYYFIQKSTGQYVRTRNLQDPNMEKRCHVMIAGADPDDRKASKTANPMPTAPYMVIDGERKQAKFEVDGLVKRAYLEHLVERDADIVNFCNHATELVDLPLGTRLCDLYEAQRILENESQWNYASVIKSISHLEPHFTAQSCLLQFVLDRLCNEGRYLSSFAAEDERNHLVLLNLLAKLIRKHSLSAFDEQIVRISCDYVSGMLNTGKEAARIDTYLKEIKNLNATFYKGIIEELVGNQKLSAVHEHSILNGTADFSAKLLDLINDYLISHGQRWNSIFTSPCYSRLINPIMQKAVADEGLSAKFLTTMAGDAKAIDMFIALGSTMAGGNESQRIRWWKTMLANNIPASQLCTLIDEKRIGEGDIESILCIQIKAKGCTEEIRGLFNKYLAKIPGRGTAFYSEWIRSALSSQQRIQSLNRALGDIAANSNHAHLLQNILTQLDAELRFVDDKENQEFAQLIMGYATRVRVVCPNTMLWLYINAICSVKISRRDRDGLAGAYLAANAGAYVHQASRSYMSSPMAKQYTAKLVEHSEEPAAHLIAMLAIDYPDASTAKEIFEEYATVLCTSSIKHRSLALASLVYLADCLNNGEYLKDPVDQLLPKFDHAVMKSKMEYLRQLCIQALSEIKTDGVSEKLVANAEKAYGQRTANNLDSIFQIAQSTYQKNHKGVFSGLMGLFKGKK